MLKSMLSAAAALFIAAGAQADEVWTTDIGEVIYEEDIGDVAVLSFPIAHTHIRGMAYIHGLGGNYDDRGRFTGYWVEPNNSDEEAACPVSISDHNGNVTNSWGRLEMIFVDTGFPSAWIAVRGDCFEEPTQNLTGKPVIG